MASAAERRRAQRELAKLRKQGRTPIGDIGQQSRQAAKKARERPILESDPVKARVKAKKRQIWDTLQAYNSRNADSYVDESSAYEEMREFLDDFDEGTASDYASQAAIAHIKLRTTGDAGELEFYLPFDFLFYH